jgi:hypothetical protein
MHVLSSRDKSSLQNIGTRFMRAFQQAVDGCYVDMVKVDGLWYLNLLTRHGDTIYSYHMKPGTDFTFMYKLNNEERVLLLDNNPSGSVSDKKAKSHKWVFDRTLEHYLSGQLQHK